jgi:hypothetical protein
MKTLPWNQLMQGEKGEGKTYFYFSIIAYKTHFCYILYFYSICNNM